MSTSRVSLLALTISLLFACSDDSEGQTGGQPGHVTGPCIQGQCLPGLLCLPTNECYPSAGSGSGNASNASTPDPTETGSTGGASDSSTTDPVTTGLTTTPDPPDTTTGVDTTSTTSATSASTTSATSASTTTTTGMPPDTSTTLPNTSDDSNGFIDPDTDTNGDQCGIYVCTPQEVCALVGEDEMCLQQCDPLNFGSCWVEEVCAPWQGGEFFVCAPDASGNLGTIGDGCQYANGCDPGHTCVTGQYVAGCNSPNCCSMFCDLDLADPCLQYGMTCNPWYDGVAPPGHEDVGVCLL